MMVKLDKAILYNNILEKKIISTNYQSIKLKMLSFIQIFIEKKIGIIVKNNWLLPNELSKVNKNY